MCETVYKPIRINYRGLFMSSLSLGLPIKVRWDLLEEKRHCEKRSDEFFEGKVTSLTAGKGRIEKTCT